MRIGSVRISPLLGLWLGLLLLIGCLGFSLGVGQRATSVSAVLGALTRFDGSPSQVVIRTVRLPRTLIAMTVGANLAVAGALMQALTRNPLAAPGILGINAGAALMVVVAVYLLKTSSLGLYAWFAFLGAGLAAAAVFLLASLSKGGVTPLKLTVAGAAFTALLSSLMQGILLVNERTLDEVRFWLAGSVAGRDLGLYLQVLPYAVAGLAGAMLLGRQVTALSLGEEVARGLGQRTGWVKAAVIGLVVVLAGSSVAVAGPIGFVGLGVPHVSRALVGPDYRWVLPYSAVLGAVLLVLADMGARFIIAPEEAPVGVMTALLGVPFFIYLARREVRRG